MSSKFREKKMRCAKSARIAAAAMESLELRRLLSTTWYVDAAANGPTHDGTSWSNAYTDLQQALASAAAGDAIHVAQGTYKPTATTDRTISFQLKTGVEIDGGYAGSTSATPDARDISAYSTILSGDIGTIGTNIDNSYHVVVGSGVDATGVLDGVTITGGNANGGGEYGVDGGAILVVSGRATIRKCTFTENLAEYDGAAIYSYNYSSPSLAVSDCTFSSNEAQAGGAVYLETGPSYSATLTNCIFSDNSAVSDGGAVAIYDGTLAMTNCEVDGNTASDGGGLSMLYSPATVALVGCSFRSNAATDGGGAISSEGSSLTLSNCKVMGNSANNGDGIANGSSSSYQQLTNSVFCGNSANMGGAIYDIATSPHTMTNCTFTGNHAFRGGGIAYTYASPVLNNCILWGDSAALGLEVYGRTATASYCDIQGGLTGTGNLNVDPLFFRNPNPGADGEWGTTDDDYGDLRLQSCSPVADAGNNASVPAGTSLDLAGNSRFQDIPTTPNSGSGTAPIVDIGAYEAVPALSAIIGGPYYVVQNQNLTLHALGASDAAGPLQYAWDFDNDGLFDDANGPNPNFGTTAALSTLPISMRLTDGASKALILSTTITIVRPVLYVDPASTGLHHDGSSWVDAYTTLQDALTVAVAGQRIDVAQGTYMPTSTMDRSISFQLKTGVAIYGGYAGSTSSTSDARDVNAYPTILSGDIDAIGDSADNSYHVVDGSYTDSTAILDGVTITGGNANGSPSPNSDGGGMLNLSGSPTLVDCTFVANAASGAGGGMYNIGSRPVLLRCTFVENVATSYGGAMLNNESVPYITDCIFDRNRSQNAGAISNGGSHPYLTNCSFNDNSASLDGGAVYNGGYTFATFVNCTFSSNLARFGGGAIYNDYATPVFTGCIFSGNSAAVLGSQIDNAEMGYAATVTYTDVQGGYAGTGNIDADPMFYRNPSPGADGTWGTADDDYGDLRLLPNSPCIDAGSNSAVPAGVTTDIAGNARIVDFPGVKAAGAIVDMGAYEANTNLGVMHLTSGQNVVLPPGHHTFSVTQLTIDPGATLDLKDDSLVIDYTGLSPLGSWNSDASDYAGINGAIESGAIFSSLAQSKYTTLAAAEASDVLSLTGSATTIWGGQTVDSTAVLIKFTYAGDANLDGKVNIDDYGRIDGNVGQSGKIFGWYNGDFNYDGKINIDDYGLIDSVIGTQGAVL